MIPLFVPFLVSMAFLPFIVRQILQFPDTGTRFVLAAIWLRLVFGAMSEFTSVPLFAGLTPLALYTLSLTLTSTLFLFQKNLYNTTVYLFAPILLIMIVSLGANILLSSTLNPHSMSFSEAAEQFASLLFFINMSCLITRAFILYDFDRLMTSLIWILALPVPLLLIAVGLGEARSSPGATPGYPAGYAHNSVPSLIFLCLMCVAALKAWEHRVVPLLIGLVCFLLIYLTNYRTTIVGALPVFFAMLIIAFYQIKHATAVFVIGAGVLLCLSVPAWLLLPNMVRDFAEIAIVMQDIGVIFEPPEALFPDERRLFTGRVFLWAQAIDAWNHAPMYQKMLGLGPGAYRGMFDFPPHSGYVSYLFNTGIIGLIWLIGIIALHMLMALRIPNLNVRIAAFAGLGGFAIVNIAAEPIRSIEGLLLFATLTSAVWAFAGSAASGMRNDAFGDGPATGRIGSRWRERVLQEDGGRRDATNGRMRRHSGRR